MFSSLLVLVLAVVAPSVHATVFVTSPTASTSWPAGQQETISWQDDGNTPTLASFGPCSIGLYAGSQQQQTLLQTISNVDVSKVSSVTWQPDATVGPNYNAYFIRFTSNSLPNPTQSGAFAEAFSAKFTLTGMTGTFNATVAAEISGTSPSSTAGSSTPVTSGSSTSTTSKLSTSTVKSSSSPTSSTSSNSKNGAGRIVVPSVVGASGAAAIAFAFFL